MRMRFCPQCKSTEVEDYAGGITGTVKCKACGYVGSLVLEKTFIKQMKE